MTSTLAAKGLTLLIKVPLKFLITNVIFFHVFFINTVVFLLTIQMYIIYVL